MHAAAGPDPPPPPSSAVQSPYQTNIMIAGYDEKVGPSLYWMDYLATLNKVNTGGVGYGEPEGVAPPPRRRRSTHAVRRAAGSQGQGAAAPAPSWLPLPSHSLAAGSYFTLSLFDKMWHPDVTEDEALKMMEAGIAEVGGATGAGL